MTAQGADERHLTELHPLRRNRYYYGKVLDVLQLSTEQEYGMANRMVLDRLVLGRGIVAGLGVTVARSGAGLQVWPGVAIDGWGRTVVVPAAAIIEPIEVSPPCGEPECGDEDAPGHVIERPGTVPVEAAAESVAATETEVVSRQRVIEPPRGLHAIRHYVIRLVYRECVTDYAAAEVPNPNCGAAAPCEAGTTVESYCLEVVEGTAPAARVTCPDDMAAWLLGHGDRPQLAPDVPADPAIVLCNVTVDGKSIQIDTSPRPVVPTNGELLELIFCLFRLVRELCGKSDTKPREPSHDPVKGTGPATVTTPASGRRPAAGGRSVRQPAKGPGK